MGRKHYNLAAGQAIRRNKSMESKEKETCKSTAPTSGIDKWNYTLNFKRLKHENTSTAFEYS